MGIFDSKSTNKQQIDTTSLQDVDGIAIGSGRDISLNILDSGVVNQSLSTVESVAGQSTDLSRDAIRELRDTSRDALDFSW